MKSIQTFVVFILIAHEGDNLVSIYDVVAGAVAAEFECESPRNVLWRGNQVITASRNEGVIRFFVEHNGNWKQTRQWRVPKTGVVHVSAASGRAFKGQLSRALHSRGSQQAINDIDANKTWWKQHRSAEQADEWEEVVFQQIETLAD